jgi:conjugative transfer signal peptidase TraF
VRQSHRFFIACLLVFLGCLVGGLSGFRINLTPSMPLGLWKRSGGIVRGNFVAACIPPDSEAMQLALQRGYIPSGRCPGGIAPVLKQIVAAAGDTIILTDQDVAVNGTRLVNSRTLASDSAGRPLSAFRRGAYHVEPGEYWLISTDRAESFDSRYFGPVPESGIVDALVPFATVGGSGPSEALVK